MLGKSQRLASLPPIDVHLCFCVCETLEFWRRITFVAGVFVAIFAVLSVTPTVSHYSLLICHVYSCAVIVCLFEDMCYLCLVCFRSISCLCVTISQSRKKCSALPAGEGYTRQCIYYTCKFWMIIILLCLCIIIINCKVSHVGRV